MARSSRPVGNDPEICVQTLMSVSTTDSLSTRERLSGNENQE